MKIHIRLFLILFMLAAYPAAAQGQLRFDKLTVSDGITQSEVYCFLKSSHGFVWFGTVSGLNRFDGYSVATYNTDMYDEYSLTGNSVYSLAEDPLLRMWVGTNSGLNIYEADTDRFHSVMLPGTGPSVIVRSLLFDGDKMWICTTDGLFIADTSRPVSDMEAGISRFELPLLPTSALGVHSVVKDGGDRIWICSDNELYLLDRESSPKRVLEIGNDGYFYRSKIDGNGNIWIGWFGKGLLKYDPGADTYSVYSHDPGNPASISSNKISDIETDADGNMWVSTIDNGINFIPKDNLDGENFKCRRTVRNVSYPDGLASDLIYSLYCKDGILWVGTIGSGVNYLDFNQKRFDYYGSPESVFIRSVYADEKAIWAGSHNNGLFRIDRTTRRPLKIALSNDAVYHIAFSDAETMWISASNGLHILDPATYRRRLTVIDNIPCFHLTPSSQNVFWSATILGVYRIEYRRGKVISILRYDTSTNPALSHPNCRVIKYNPHYRELWIGTEGGGAHIMQLDDNHFPKSVRIYRQTPGTEARLSNNNIRDIHIQSPDLIWLATYEGLNCFKRNVQAGEFDISFLTKHNGLPNNTIESIQSDYDGNLWVGTNGGISKITADLKSIVNYDVNDGLQDNEFSEHASFMTDDGEFFFGGTRGITGFYPHRIISYPRDYRVAVTDLYIFNEKIAPGCRKGGMIILDKPMFMTESLVLRHRQNNLRFDFSAMSYSSPKKIGYSYRLAGYDEEWFYTDALHRSASYTNLGHGKYLFEVRARDEKGNWGRPAAVSICILTPFYLKWYAMLFYIMATVSLISCFVFATVRKRKKSLEARHRDKMFELERTRMQLFINVSHDLQTPISLILGPLGEVMREKDLGVDALRNLGIVERNARKLQTMVEQILDIRKVETSVLKTRNSEVELCSAVRGVMKHFNFAFSEKKLDFTFVCGEEKIVLFSDPDMIDKILFNIISNSLKFTERGGVEITAGQTGEEVFIRVRDCGMGIPEDQIDRIFEKFYHNPDNRIKGYGIGLAHSKELASLLGGHISVASKAGEGSVFTITLPLSGADTNGTEEDAAAAEDETGGVKERQTILIVDDEPDMRVFIRNIFKRDYNVVEAQNGAEALGILKKTDADIVISDVVMPDMNGVEMCSSIKSHIETNHIPVILLTAMKGEHIRYKGLETGADDYLAKPFDSKELYLRVRNLVKSRKQLRSNFENRFMLDVSVSTDSGQDEAFVQKIVGAIEREYGNSAFSIEELEREFAMSHSTFYRKVKHLTGYSAKELLQVFRLKKAKQMLVNGDMSVTEISEEVGFNNQVHFSTSFKEKYGESPLQFRKSTRANR